MPIVIIFKAASTITYFMMISMRVRLFLGQPCHAASRVGEAISAIGD